MPVFALAAGGSLCMLLAALGYHLRSSGRVGIGGTASPGGQRRRKGSGTSFILAAAADLAGRPVTGLAMEALAPFRGQIRKRIDSAGRPGGMTIEGHARRTAGYILVFGTVGLLFLVSGRILLGIVILLGTGLNELTLLSVAKRRQDEIQRALPDFLDVLAVTVTAGLGFRHALEKVAQSMPGALAEEFRTTLRQLDLGQPRREAFEDLRRRNSAEAIGQFVTAIIQAEELGAPLSGALNEISSNMRLESAQWARRKAQRISPKITLVTTFTALPALMLLFFGVMIFGVGDDISDIFGR